MTTETLNSDSQILSRVNYEEIEDELLVRLRNELTDRRARATAGTESFTGTGTTMEFTFIGDLDSKSRHKIMNVKSVTVAGTAKTAYTDYIVGYRKDSDILGKIKFWNPPANSAAIVITHDYQYSFIYLGEPRVDLTSNSYPRISIQLEGTPEEAACGGKATRHEITVIISIIDTDRKYVEDITEQLKRYFVDEGNRTGFHNFDYVYITKVGKVVKSPEDENEIRYGCQIECRIPYLYEFSK